MRRFAIALLLLTAIAARGQGCSQCRDTVSQTNPAVQSSFRLAIGIMLGSVLAIGTAGVVVIRRFR